MNPYAAYCLVQVAAHTATSSVAPMVDSTVSSLLNNQEVALWEATDLQIEGEGGVAPAGLFADSYDAEQARISNAFGKKAKFKPSS